MTRITCLMAACWLFCVSVTPGAERWIAFKMVSSAEIDLSGISSIGRDVLKDPDEWLIGRSANFIVFGKNRPMVSRAVDEAENALRQAEEWLGLKNPDAASSLLVFVGKEEQWNQLVHGHGIRHDGLSIQVGNEMYFKDDPEQNKRPDRVAHEVFHLLITRTFPSGLPLWLEEGLAIHYGWKSAVRMNEQRELIIYREDPAVDEKLLVGFDKFLGIKQYPGSEEQARVFFRQSEELVAVLEERLGNENMARFVQAMSAGDRGDARKSFVLAAGWSDEEAVAVFEEAGRRCQSPRKR